MGEAGLPEDPLILILSSGFSSPVFAMRRERPGSGLGSPDSSVAMRASHGSVAREMRVASVCWLPVPQRQTGTGATWAGHAIRTGVGDMRLVIVRCQDLLVR